MNKINRAVLGMLIGLACLLSVNGCGPARPSLRIKIYIDGSDTLKVSGSKLWLEHGDFTVPRNPIYVNGKAWNTEWTNNVSTPLEGFAPVFTPVDPLRVNVKKLLGRGKVVLTERPSQFNSQTLSVHFDDNDFNGGDWYDVSISW